VGTVATKHSYYHTEEAGVSSENYQVFAALEGIQINSSQEGGGWLLVEWSIGNKKVWGGNALQEINTQSEIMDGGCGMKREGLAGSWQEIMRNGCWLQAGKCAMGFKGPRAPTEETVEENERNTQRSNYAVDHRAMKQVTRARMRAMIIEKNEMWEAKIEAKKMARSNWLIDFSHSFWCAMYSYFIVAESEVLVHWACRNCVLAM
jgi:hypothetical protein